MARHRKRHDRATAISVEEKISPVPTTASTNGWRMPLSLIALVITLIAGGYCMVNNMRPDASGTPLLTQSKNPSPPFSLGELLIMQPKKLADVDIARANLICAEGLPGTESLDAHRIEQICRTLDRWAAQVRFDTERHLYRVHDPQFRDHYRGSESRLRAEMIVTVLQTDFGVHYNPDRIIDVDFSHSEDLFIHGLVGSVNGGTCVSMPVVYVAIGRRLGYPVKLVMAPSHVLWRWEGDDHPNPLYRDKFNIEATASGGFDTRSDSHYLHPQDSPLIQQQAHLWFFKSLTPPEELALFLATRGHCLLEHGRITEAQIAYSHAHHQAPDDKDYFAWLVGAVRQELKQTEQSRQTTASRPFMPPSSRPRGVNGGVEERARRMQEENINRIESQMRNGGFSSSPASPFNHPPPANPDRRQ